MTFEPQGLKAITRQFYFDTSISNDMASTISIAAQAPNNMQSLASVSFKAFHKNIVSRFANQADLEAQQYSELENAKNQLVLDMNEYREITKSLSYYLYKLNQGNFESESARLKHTHEKMGLINISTALIIYK